MNPGRPDQNSANEMEVCSQCGKLTAAPGRIGSMTGFLFQGRYCSCDKTVKIAEAAPAAAASAGANADFCPRCGLTRSAKSQPGSLTGYLFQDTRCRCQGDEKFDSASMSQKFWKLKKEDSSSFKNREGAAAASAPNLVQVDLAEGTVIAGVYQIVKLIGRGGMGEVYLAKHLTLGKRVALKVIPPEQVNDVGWQRFQTEARLFAKLDHINLVRVSDLGVHDGCLPFYAMDFVDGQTLSEMVAQNGPLSVNDAAEIFKQVCDGVDFAHRNGIIHRDLKPANIMIARPNSLQNQSSTGAKSDKVIVKILDFGLAKLTQHDRNQQSLTAVGEVFGSPFYMSPEQCSGEKIDNRSDIYSVGCALFESLTERPPFYGSIAAAIMNGHQFGDPPSLESVVGPGKFPIALEVVVAKLLRKNPSERYQTMAELKGDLERVARGESVQPYYVSRAKGAAERACRSTESDRKQSNSAEGIKARTVLFWCGGLAGVTVVVSLVLVMASKHGVFLTVGKQVQIPQQKTKIELANSPASEDPRTGGLEGILEPSESFVAAHSKRVDWDGKLFFRGIINREGKPYFSWEFPRSLGFEYGRLGIVNPETSWVPMIGNVAAPTAAKFCIALQPTILNSPDILNGFSDGTFDGVRFENSTAKQFRKMAAVLERFQSVHRLDFRNIEVDSVSEQDCIDVINKYPNLTELESWILTDGLLFRQIRRLKMLETLVLSGVHKNGEVLFSALHGSVHLRELAVLDRPLSFEAVRELTSCPNLTRVGVFYPGNDAQSQADQIETLTALKKLDYLQFQSLKYSPALIENLSKFQKLKGLKCDLSTGWSPENRILLRKALPDTEMWLTWLVADSENEKLLQRNGQLPEFGMEKTMTHFRPFRKSARPLIR